MKKKKILLILKKKHLKESNREHSSWVYDCSHQYKFDFWGKDITDTSIESLKAKIDQFKPDYIYMTLRQRYFKFDKKTHEFNDGWLPDLTKINNVPKIFVEVDSWRWDHADPWYSQFTELYCRQPQWGNWENIRHFKWSVLKKNFPTKQYHRKGINFVGTWKAIAYMNGVFIENVYPQREEICNNFPEICFSMDKAKHYWEKLFSSSALICPKESFIGDFVPIKLFEYLASGSAVITNCDMDKAGLSSMKPFIIQYGSIDELKEKLSVDFSLYHDRAIPLMREHMCEIRYRELFG